MINKINIARTNACTKVLNNNIKKTKNIVDKKSVTLSDIIDSEITKYINSSSGNIIKNIRFHRFLNKSLEYIMKPENFLNSGRDSKVYKISDNYVARIKRGKYEHNALHCYNIAKKPNSRFNKISIYYGAPIAKIGNIEILKNATPSSYTTCGIIGNKKISVKDAIKRYNDEVIPACATVPQEGYDEFARCLKELNGIRKLNFNPLTRINEFQPDKTHNSFGKRISYTPDVLNPNNILISNNSFRLVDSFFKVTSKNPNNVYTMIEPLLTRLTPERNAEFDAATVPLKRNILRKILIASEKAELPLETPVVNDYNNFILVQVCTDKSKGIQAPYSIIENLKMMRNSAVPLKERIAFINNELLEK